MVEGMPLAAAAAGLLASAALEPRSWRRPAGAWALHAGWWLVLDAFSLAVVGRPVYAALATLAIWSALRVVDLAKRRVLHEPFVVQDFEYFLDVLRHPRLYLPFLGWWRFCAAAACFVTAVAVALWLEPAPASRLAMTGLALALAALGAGLIAWGRRQALPVTLDPAQDLARLGLAACLWRYAEAVRAPMPTMAGLPAPAVLRGARMLPHLVAVQSESFFDARALYPGVRRDVLAHFDALCRDSLSHGPLQVPAWGANTVRSEFAFLAGVAPEALGVHRFQPYWPVIRGWQVEALPALLRRLGYRTVAVHPYPASFYRRDQVYPRLGFDRFLDIADFEGAPRFGPYVSDAAVADRVTALLDEADGPLFVFVVTMENHGPLHLEQVGAGDVAALYDRPPPPGCEDLTVYLRHLRQADRMVGQLRAALADRRRPASLCWYGDHVPIMPVVYQALGRPGGETRHAVWCSDRAPRGMAPRTLAVHELAATWLALAGLGDVLSGGPATGAGTPRGRPRG